MEVLVFGTSYQPYRNGWNSLSSIIISGTVESKEDKRRAEDIAESVYGVRNVQNQLKVEHNRNESYNEKSRGTKAW